MIERRKFFRFLRQRKTQYFSQERIENKQECTIVDVSREGMKVLFHEKINLGTKICLEIPIPGELFPINVNGMLRRIEKEGNDFICGIELTKVFGDEEFRQILIGYSLSQKKINTKFIKEAMGKVNTRTEETVPPLNSKPHFARSSFRKVVSLISVAVSLFSLVFFLMMRGYFPRDLFNEGNQKRDMVAQLKEVPSGIEPTKRVANQLITSADAHPAPQHKPIVSREKGYHVALLKEEGGSLYYLALKHYRRADETLFDIILQANPGITDVRQIHEDQKITAPVINSASYIKKISDGVYRVHIGTYQTPDLASLYSNEVIDLGKKLLIQPHKFSYKDIWYRVMIGDFKSKEEALGTVDLLKELAIIYIPPERR